MKKIFFLLFFINVLLNGAEYSYKGSFILTYNKIITAQLFDIIDDSFRARLSDYNDQETWIKVSQIKKIVFLTPGDSSKVLLFLKDGRKFKIYNVGSFGFNTDSGCYRYKVNDPISGELRYQNICPRGIKEIVFDTDYGDVRIDSHQNIFPPDYIYSPYTGEKMKLIKMKELNIP